MAESNGPDIHKRSFAKAKALPTYLNESVLRDGEQLKGILRDIIKASQGNFDHLSGEAREFARLFNKLSEDVGFLYEALGIEYDEAGDDYEPGSTLNFQSPDHTHPAADLPASLKPGPPGLIDHVEEQMFLPGRTGGTGATGAAGTSGAAGRDGVPAMFPDESGDDFYVPPKVQAQEIRIADAGNDFTATNVEGALAELQSDAEAHLADTSDVHDHGSLSGLSDDDHPQYATNAEFDDHSARHENGGADEISIAGLDGTPTDLQTHLDDTADAHDASAISIADAGNDFTATTVEGALDELQADNETHAAAADPHAGYVLESLIDAAGDFIRGSADNTVARQAASAATPGAVSTSGATGTGTNPPSADDHVHAHEAAHVAHDTVWAAKGDIVGGTGNDTAAVLTVGADDTILMADAAAANGLKWVASASPSAVSTAAATGTADTFTRGDHVHAHEAAHINHDTTWAAKGDLIAGTANDTAGVLTVGTDGYVLTAASGETTGLEWAEATGGGGGGFMLFEYMVLS